eukprot:7738077-Alexandrium_andersonii.AAC.1
MATGALALAHLALLRRVSDDEPSGPSLRAMIPDPGWAGEDSDVDPQPSLGWGSDSDVALPGPSGSDADAEPSETAASSLAVVARSEPGLWTQILGQPSRVPFDECIADVTIDCPAA